MGREKRKKFYQKELALYRSLFTFFIIAGVGAAILAAFYLLFSSAVVDLLINEGGPSSASGPVALLGDILTGAWLYITIGGLLLVILATLFTHRFAGPLYRFEVSLDTMIKGDVSFKIVLRKKDECKSLADKINMFNSNLCSSLDSMSAIASEIETRQEKLKAEYGSSETLENAMKANRRIKNILSGYKFKKA